MKLRRRVDLGLLIVAAICLLALWPFLSRPGLPLETDAELHVFRTAELSQLLQGGAFYPRWAPDFYFGHGYPLFNYYAPLTYYLGAALMVLPGVDAVLAVKLVFLLGLLGAGLGMYLLGRRLWGERPGVVAAAAYLYAPYIQYIDPHARGVLAESFSFALFPWVLWAFTARTERQGDAVVSEGAVSTQNSGRLVLAAWLLAALVCTHNLMALVLTAILLAWIVWQRVTLRVTSLRHLLTALFLGVGLSAFFWLPVALERDAVQLGNLISDGGHFDFRNHFLTVSELLRPTRLLDLGATDPRYAFSLGAAQWALALMAAASLFWWLSPRRKPAIFFALVGGLLFLLLLPISSPIWERVPLMPFLQFPWRLLGPLAACLALLAASGFAALEFRLGSRGADWALGATLFLVLILAIPLTYPSEWPAEFGPTDPWGILQRELKGRWLGTTSTGDYVPAGVIVVPRANKQVIESYRDGVSVDRVNRAVLPAGTKVEQDFGKERPLAWTFQVDGQVPFILRLFHFYFPGWVATLDDEPIPIETAKPEGFMTVQVPAGRHEISFAFRDTPARKAAWLVSGLALVASLFLAVSSRRSQSRPDLVREITPAILLVPLVLFTFKLALADPLGWFRVRSTGNEVIVAEHTVHYRVGEHVALIGYDWQPAGPGKTANLTLYWKAIEPVPVNYQVYVHLRDPTGAVAAQSDRLNPGDYPARQWPLDKYVRDEHRMLIPEGLPPGEYDLVVGLWLMAEGERLPVADRAGNLLGDGVWLESQVIR